jgi:hypothetical protein
MQRLLPLSIPVADICMIYWQHLTPKSTCLQSPYLLLVHNIDFSYQMKSRLASLCKTAIVLHVSCTHDDLLLLFCFSFLLISYLYKILYYYRKYHFNLSLLKINNRVFEKYWIMKYIYCCQHSFNVWKQIKVNTGWLCDYAIYCYRRGCVTTMRCLACSMKNNGRIENLKAALLFNQRVYHQRKIKQ